MIPTLIVVVIWLGIAGALSVNAFEDWQNHRWTDKEGYYARRVVGVFIWPITIPALFVKNAALVIASACKH